MIEERLIRKETGQYDLELIQRLSLDRQFIRLITSMDNLVNLVDLSLAENDISAMSGLESAANLRRLNLSHNKIRRVEFLECMTKLEWFDISYNKIESLTDSMDAIRCLPTLTSLGFGTNSAITDSSPYSPNPACESKKYPAIVFQYLPNVNILDGALVSMLREIQDANNESEKVGESSVEELDESNVSSWLGNHDKSAEETFSNENSFLNIAESHTRSEKMLKEDCGHLLRKAEKMM